MVDHPVVDRRTTAELRQRLRQVNATIAAIDSRVTRDPRGFSRRSLASERRQLEAMIATRRDLRDERIVSFRQWRDGARS
jgi:hypothetical protein